MPSAVFVDRALAAADDDGRDASTDLRAVEPDFDVFAGGMASRAQWTIPRKVAICGRQLCIFFKKSTRRDASSRVHRDERARESSFDGIQMNV